MTRFANILILLLLAGSAHAQKILDFTQANCQPCAQMAPLVETLTREGVPIERVDTQTERGQQLCQQYKVPRTPTYIGLDANGKITGRIEGVTTRAQLTALVRKANISYAAQCRIHVKGDGSTGSGTLVAVKGDKGVVLTCAHLFSESKEGISATFPDGFTSAGGLIEIDKANDVATIAINKPKVQPVEVAEDDPAGELTACGFDGNGTWKSSSGRLIRWTRASGATDDSAVIQATVRPGDSGGAVLDSRGRLVGVVWGCRPEDGQTYLMCRRPVLRILGRWRRPQSVAVYPPYNGDPGTQAPAPVGQPNPQPPTQPNPPVDPGPGDSACNCREQIIALNLRITQLESQTQSHHTEIANLWQSVETAGQAGQPSQNDSGPTGPPNYDAIAAEVAKRFQPLNIRINDPRGAAYSTDYKQWQIRTLDQPAQYVKLPFQPVTQAK